MPIEIKELHIKAIVAGKEPDKNTGNSFTTDELNKLKKEILNEVTEKVLRTLRQKSER
ncbi:DUF5908 family protein [Solitalea sp. MAHUQ-68]|uniref:DUF5908 family protein n=1 Tax=Solitalea agri TaxID=2953739 RepID=A0A9X2F9S5_9SPHI|nr:DUF5908 family protein [Solitalea agri]MCO4294453.1 DUF5908 family protein [Solitalea agri]